MGALRLVLRSECLVEVQCSLPSFLLLPSTHGLIHRNDDLDTIIRHREELSLVNVIQRIALTLEGVDTEANIIVRCEEKQAEARCNSEMHAREHVECR
jgi:hypothetical protein